MKAYWNCTKEQLEEMFGFREKGLTEEEVDKFSENIEEVKKCKKLYLSTDILLTAKQEQLFEDNNIKIYVIPECYFQDEIMEVQ